MYGNPLTNDLSSWEWRSIKNHWVERQDILRKIMKNSLYFKEVSMGSWYLL